ncbi:hypothetical protein SEVIR_5G407000v4 [Setaria viridis]
MVGGITPTPLGNLAFLIEKVGFALLILRDQ